MHIFLFIILINIDLIRRLMILIRMLFLVLLGAVGIGWLRDTWGWNSSSARPYGPSAITRGRQLILIIQRKIQVCHPFFRGGINAKIRHLFNVLNCAIFLDGLRSGGRLDRHSKITVKSCYRRLRSLPLSMSESVVTGSLLVLIRSQNWPHLGPLSLHVRFLVTVKGHIGVDQTWAAVVHHAPHAHGDRFRALLVSLSIWVKGDKRLTRKEPFYFKIYCSA
jgi:hypothetical protein